MSQQHQKWIQIVKDKLNSEGMTQTHLARACGVKKPTISELLKYGKGSDRLKNRVCDVLGIDESWVDLESRDMSIDLLSANVVMDEEILSNIDNTFGSLVKGLTKDQKIKFILYFYHALSIAKFLTEHPELIEKQKQIYEMILKKAQE